MEKMPQMHPDTENNRLLTENVHPSDWANPVPAQIYNLVVIGAGTAGLVTAAGAASLGAKVALVERSLMGGDCLNFGCVPSKGMIRAARAAGDIRRSAEFGISAAGDIDFTAAMERMRKVRAEISPHDSARRFRDELGIDVFFGAGRFAGADTIDVDGKTLRFKRAAICTGARAVELPIPGLSETGYLTNETVFSLTSRPERLLVIGGGPLGCEMAQAFARLGSQVSILDNGEQLLPREDRDAADIIRKAFIKEEIRLFFRTKIIRAERRGGLKSVVFEQDGKEVEISVDDILVGIGRAPNVGGLGLEAAGVEYDGRKGISVNDRLQTTNPRIFAAGDICSPYKFTHMADAMARIVIANALFYGRQKVSDLVIPWCTYTDPEIAHVGMYEEEAGKKSYEVTTLTVPLKDVDRAMLDGDTEGFARVHLKKGTDRILGATIVARNAGDMISELSLAITGGLGLSSVGKTIHPYPTQAEAIKKLADAHNRTRLTPFAKKVLDSWLRWQRSFS